jgi:geranylgeranyl diphosphate synthase, type II
MNFDIKDYLKEKRAYIDDALSDLLDLKTDDLRIVDAMTYSLMANGKRLRPILCIAAAEAVGGQTADALPAACALEMIHTYSLIHDDLPAMDDDNLRRGKPTCHIAFDEATAVLAGDALLTFAFQTISQNLESKSDPKKEMRSIAIIAKAAGHEGMISGQMLDMVSEGQKIDLTALKKMHRLKTGALIEASLASGAVMGGGTDDDITRLSSYGQHIGLAFQVVDDILNVEGDPSALGKAVGSDAARQKCTYPSLMGLDASKAYAQDLIKRALHVLAAFDKKADPLRAIARYVIERRR